MPAALPDGDPAPPSGRLPDDAVAGMPSVPFGIYAHVPFCRVRCGYCDFNTYTFADLGTGLPAGATPATYVDAVLRELDLAVVVLGHHAPPVDTVFVGGGTPTLLPSADLARLVHGIRDRWGLARDAEVTTEANPDTVTVASARALATAGYTRVSLGMQSAVPHVLTALDRSHDPDHVATAVAAVRRAGMQVSLDLIYGTPGESERDWRASLDAALELEPDHVSAYALVVEEGTRLAARIRRGELAMPQDDDEAAKYEIADAVLSGAGFDWYEVSNWARGPGARCRHNVGYWTGASWWGAGPGAHSHVGGVRWWNVRHPAAYAQRVATGQSPAAGREVLDDTQRHDEDVLLRVRLAEGLAIDRLQPPGLGAVAGLVADGLVDGAAAVAERRVRLTLRGRLLADTVVRRLLLG
jgi:oxygen-independent coproporphyrinogen-3 oxidase